MKKLLLVLLGLSSINIYANGCGGEYQPATGTCRIIQADKFYIMSVSLNLQIVVLHKIKLTLLISKFLQNMEHGQSILKQVYQVEHLRWIHLPQQKKRLLKPVKEVEKINRAKLMLGFAMAVSPLLKEKMVQLFLV